VHRRFDPPSWPDERRVGQLCCRADRVGRRWLAHEPPDENRNDEPRERGQVEKRRAAIKRGQRDQQPGATVEPISLLPKFCTKPMFRPRLLSLDSATTSDCIDRHDGPFRQSHQHARSQQDGEGAGEPRQARAQRRREMNAPSRNDLRRRRIGQRSAQVTGYRPRERETPPTPCPPGYCSSAGRAPRRAREVHALRSKNTSRRRG